MKLKVVVYIPSIFSINEIYNHVLEVQYVDILRIEFTNESYYFIKLIENSIKFPHFWNVGL